MLVCILHTVAFVGLPFLVSEEKQLIRVRMKGARFGFIRNRKILATNPEDEPMHDARFEIDQFCAGRDDILNPDLRAVVHADHLYAEPIVRGHREKGAGEHKVGFEHRPRLRSGNASPGERKHRIARNHRNPRRSMRAKPAGDFFRDGGTQMGGDVVARGEWHDGYTKRRTRLR